MSELILTGFHAVEERVRNASVNKDTVSSMQIFYSKPGPRIKKILEQAKKTALLNLRLMINSDEMTKNLGNAEEIIVEFVIRHYSVQSKPDIL